MHEEPTSPGKVLNSLGFSSLAVPEVASLVVPGVSSLALAEASSLALLEVSSLATLGVSSLAVPEVSSLAMLHEGQKGLDHGFKAQDKTSWISKVVLLATAAWGLQMHQVVPW